MKKQLILLFLNFLCIFSFAQKPVFLRGIEFDSSYSVIGIGRNYQGVNDSLPGYWFILDDPRDMEALKKDWVLKDGSIKGLEFSTIDVFVTKDKQRIQSGALIYPVQGRINVNDHWYKFDTAKLSLLHREHPLRFHSERQTFDTFLHYVAYANSILHDSLLLFFFEPSLKYEGEFIITASRTNDPDSRFWAQKDINEALEKLAPKGTFVASAALNDSFNIKSHDKVRIKVQCSKSLYDKYKEKYVEKGPWQPTAVVIETFWRD